MSQMRTHKINGGGVKEVSRPRQSKKAILPEVREQLYNEGSSIRRQTQSCGQNQAQRPQWPFPTKVLDGLGNSLAFNSDNFEEALF